MKNYRNMVMTVALSIVLFTATTSSPMTSADQERTITIPVEKIGNEVTLVGILGQPLGKLMEVKGTWAYPDKRVKDYSLRFRVSQVNGNKLPKPVEFNVAQIKAVTRSGKNAIPKHEERKKLEGVSWTFRAYETGRFRDVPEDYWKELGKPTGGRPYWYKKFTPELVGIVQE